MKEKIKKIIDDFLAKMLIFEAEVKVGKVKDSYGVSLNLEEPGMLIGKNGETLKALEHLLRLLVNKKMEKSVNLSLDIAGYKDKRRQEIEEMAKAAAESALRSGRVQLLLPMNAYERRIVHLILAKRDDLETESVGEEPNRRVMIKIKKKELV